MYSLEALKQSIEQGAERSYLFFWGHTPKQAGVVDKSCLSQWYPSRFEVDGIPYATAEHYMMAGKARLFGDQSRLEQILVSETAKDAKGHGRKVANFDTEVWQATCFDIVVQANLAKFSQDSALNAFLLATGDQVLVEASPYDKIWGIGMKQSDPDALNPMLWQGTNLLGFALMAVRDQLV